jgi:hypothetical protein
MTVRIDWSTSAVKKAKELRSQDVEDEEDDDEEDGGAGGGGKSALCKLVWTGLAAKRSFSGFRFDECPTPASARKLMHTFGLAHYWDMVVTAERQVKEGASDVTVLTLMTASADEDIDTLLAAPAAASNDMELS